MTTNNLPYPVSAHSAKIAPKKSPQTLRAIALISQPVRPLPYSGKFTSLSSRLSSPFTYPNTARYRRARAFPVSESIRFCDCLFSYCLTIESEIAYVT
jgi:hypothetical protein